MQTKNIFWDNAIFIDCSMEPPIPVANDNYMAAWNKHLSTLTRYPYMGEPLKDGQEVAEGKDYELQHQAYVGRHKGIDHWQDIIPENETLRPRRIVAIGIPKATEIDKNNSVHGYASGNYSCKCIDCNKEFMGAKGAIRCYSCAIEIIRNQPLSEKTSVFGKKRNCCNKHEQYFDEKQCSVCISEKTEEIKKVNRVEVIDENGRSYTKRFNGGCELSYQDQGRTLKIFIEKEKTEEKETQEQIWWEVFSDCQMNHSDTFTKIMNRKFLITRK